MSAKCLCCNEEGLLWSLGRGGMVCLDHAFHEELKGLYLHHQSTRIAVLAAENERLREALKEAVDLLDDAWRQWCEEAGEEQARRRSKAWFTSQMTTRDITSGGDGGQKYIGVQLR